MMMNIKRRIAGVIEWCDTYYWGFACMVVGIPLLGLMVMEVACYIWLLEMNVKLTSLGV